MVEWNKVRRHLLFFGVQKTNNTLWLMLRVIKGMYESCRSEVLHDGKMSEVFDVEQDVTQGCGFSPFT